MLIDHLVYAAPDLPAAVTEVEGRFGVRAQAGGKHNGSGTHNALPALGAQTYLEIIRPAGTAAFVARLSSPNGSHVLR